MVSDEMLQWSLVLQTWLLLQYITIQRQMGIVGAVKDYCLAPSQQQRVLSFLDNNGKSISQDYTYFQQQNWFRLQTTILFDPNKFIFLYINYKQLQQKLCDQWKIVDTKKFKNTQKIVFNDEPLQPKWIYAIRRGIPIKYYKNIIQLMFARSFNQDGVVKKYQALLYERVKRNGNKIDPVTFKQQSEESTFTAPFSNKQGIEAAKRISFLLSKTHSQLQYNMYIINIISILLIFIPEADTYDIIGTMIEGSTSMSLQRQQSLRWHFTLTNNQLQKFARQFYKTVKDISPSIRIINQHLNTEGIDKFRIFQEIIGDFFIGYVPFHIVLQIFMIFLNEGAKIFYRFFYAILKVAGQAIRDSSNTKQIIRVIRTKLLTSLNTQKNIKQFFRYAYDLQLQDFLTKKTTIELKRKISKKQFATIYYLPEIVGDSQILSFLDMETIWGFLPTVIKHYGTRKIFFSSDGNTNLKKMLNCLQEFNITLLIIETVNDAVFGVFMAEKLKSLAELQGQTLCKSTITTQFTESLTNIDPKMKHSSSLNALMSLKDLQHFGSSQNFIFSLRPHPKKYPATGQNIYYCSYNDDNFLIGGPQPAIQLGTSLAQGFSYSSSTYGNQPLHGGTAGEFKIKLLQCFSIQ